MKVLSTKFRRIVVATLGLSVAGAAFGGIAGAIAVVLWGILRTSEFRLVGAGYGMMIAGVVGAMFGAVLGPLAAWGLLRYVPLGVAVMGAALGAMIGGTATALLPVVPPVVGGAIGLFGASFIMRRHYMKKLKTLQSAPVESEHELLEGETSA